MFLGPENVEQGGFMWAVWVRFPKPLFPWHQDQNAQAAWEDPAHHWELPDQILWGDVEGGSWLFASLLRLFNCILLNFPAGKIKASLDFYLQKSSLTSGFLGFFLSG